MVSRITMWLLVAVSIVAFTAAVIAVGEVSKQRARTDELAGIVDTLEGKVGFLQDRVDTLAVSVDAAVRMTDAMVGMIVPQPPQGKKRPPGEMAPQEKPSAKYQEFRFQHCGPAYGP